jgi:type IV pilus assembly protein PilE
MRGRGFTLIELMVAVAIIAILAATAMPAYRDHAIRSQLIDATAALADQRVRMEQYYADNRTYGGSSCGPKMPTLELFALTCTPTAGGQGYSIEAAGKSGTSVAGFSYAIDQANKRSTTGWGSVWGAVPEAGSSRWLIRKD